MVVAIIFQSPKVLHKTAQDSTRLSTEPVLWLVPMVREGGKAPRAVERVEMLKRKPH